MNTLDLNAYGVQEMNKQEMVETDGGWLFLIPIAKKVGKAIVGGLATAAAIDHAADFVESFQEGYNEVRNR